MPDAHANFAYSTVATAPSPATTGTSLVVQAGHGARFPAAPFNAVVWPTGADPTSANAEIVRVTGRSTDTLTIDREEEGTSARTVVVGDQIMSVITAKTLTDIETPLADGWVPAGETWTYGSADDPTYTFTISGDLTAKYSAGMRVRVSQTTGGTKYGIITRVVHATGTTTVTVFMGTDYDLANEAISSPHYSMVKAPAGFPLDPAKWTVEWSSTSNYQQNTPTIDTWYDIVGSSPITIPIGVWNVSYSLFPYLVDTGRNGTISTRATLSTGSGTESDQDWTRHIYLYCASDVMGQVENQGVIALTSKQAYYVNLLTGQNSVDSIRLFGAWSPNVIRAVCAYL